MMMDKKLLNEIIKNSDDGFIGFIVETKRGCGMSMYHIKSLMVLYNV